MFSPLIISIVGVVVVLALFGFLIMSRYKVAKPNEALIITGRKKNAAGVTEQRVVLGGTFVWPIIQTASTLDVSARRLNVSVKGAASKNGILLNVDGVAIVRVRAEDEGAIRAVASRYLNSQGAIAVDTTEVLAGALRSIIGKMSVDEILRDREAFASEVTQVTEQSLTSTGLMLDSFQIQDVIDQGGPDGQPGTYLRNLGRPEEARAAQEAAIADARALRVSEQERLSAEKDIAMSVREVSLQKAQNKEETDAADAKAAAAGPLAEAAARQEVIRQQQLVAEEQAKLTDKELDTTVRKPADARKYARIAEAEAEKAATMLSAEASAAQEEQAGLGEKKRRLALAEAIREEGLANATAVEAVGSAEASAMSAKAAAYKEYSQAAIVETMVAVLPQVAREVAAPLGGIENFTVISTDGASKVSETVTRTFTEVQNMLHAATGIDLTEMVKGFANASDAIPTESSVKEVERSSE